MNGPRGGKTVKRLSEATNSGCWSLAVGESFWSKLHPRVCCLSTCPQLKVDFHTHRAPRRVETDAPSPPPAAVSQRSMLPFHLLPSDRGSNEPISVRTHKAVPPVPIYSPGPACPDRFTSFSPKAAFETECTGVQHRQVC